MFLCIHSTDCFHPLEPTIGRDVNACIEAGKLALIAAYALDTVKH